MPSKISFTYEYIPDQWDKSPKVSTGLVLENATDVHVVLEQFKNFLSSAGYVFDISERLDIVTDDSDELHPQDQNMNQGDGNAS